MIRSRHRSLWFLLLALAVAALFVALRFKVTTDVSVFLPEGEQREQGRILGAVARGAGSRTLVLSVETPSAAQAAEASRVLEAELRADPRLASAVEHLEAGPSEGTDASLWRLLEPHRLAYAAWDSQQARALVRDEGLDRAFAGLLHRLTSPMSTFVTQVAPNDPFLAVPGLLEYLQSHRSDRLAVVEGRFVAEDRFAIVFLATRASALDATAQAEVFAGIDRAVARAREQVPSLGAVQTSGVAKFAVRSESMIRNDIQRTTILTAAGLAIVCFAVFGSLRIVALASVPIGCAMLFATAVCLALFGEVHGLTFAFGASLIGVCVDYVVHLVVHHMAAPASDGPRKTLERIWPALWVGGVTTMVGFAVMGGSSFPGLRQVAVFAAVGVASALVATRVLLPPLLRVVPERGRFFDRLGTWLEDALVWLQARRRFGWGLCAAACALTAYGVAYSTWDDDLQRLGQLDPELVAEDERVRARVARLDQSRFVVALAASEEEALRVNDAVAAALVEATDAGEIGAWQGVAPLLWSARHQSAVAEVFRSDPTLPARIAAAADRAGFDAEAFQPFVLHLQSPKRPPITFEELVQSPAAPLVRPLRLAFDGRIAFLTMLRDVKQPAALAARLQGIEGAMYLDQRELMDGAMQTYRVRTLELLVLGVLVVFGIVLLRYRNVRIAAAAFAPAVLATGVTLGVLAILRLPLNLLGLTAILMVLSIGVDYGVFLAETRDAKGVAPTLVALVMCWATTVIGFGALVISEHPAMYMIGVVASVGVSASLFLTPVTFTLLPAREPHP